jgi:hypothetical protein
VANHRIRPLGLARLRSAVPLGWAGLFLWLWATAFLPALHAAQHAREAAEEPGYAPNRQRIQALIDEVLAHPHGSPHPHHHGPGQAPHGKGALEHLGALFAAAAAFAPPSGLEPHDAVFDVRSPAPPALVAPWRPQHPRGPPSLLSARRCS